MSDPHEKPPENPSGLVPKAVISRLSLYLRRLEEFVRVGSELSFAEFHDSFDGLDRFVVAVCDPHFGELLDGRDHVRVIGSVQFFGQREELPR